MRSERIVIASPSKFAGLRAVNRTGKAVASIFFWILETAPEAFPSVL